MDILYQLLPIIPVFASTGSNILTWAAAIGGAIAAALIIVSLVKDVASYAKGSGDGSILKIAGKIIFLVIILGVIAYVAGQADGTDTSGLAGTIVNKANEEIGSALNGTT